MPFLMVALNRSKSGAYVARKGIPKDVQAEYARLYGQCWEAKLTLPADLKPQEAKAKHAEWLANIETRINTIRAGQNGVRQSLTQKQANALAGEWYREFTARHEDNPGSPERWNENFWVLLDQLLEYAPESITTQDRKDLDLLVRDPEVRAGIRPAIAKEMRADQFLASKGLSLTQDAYNLFLDCLLAEYLAAVLLLERRARGDFFTDERLEQFPAFNGTSKPHTAPKAHKSAAALTPWKLFEAWVDAKKPALATVSRWRSVFLDLERHFRGREANSMTADEAQAWADGSVTAERSAATVKVSFCNAAHTVFAWAVKSRKLDSNPFDGVAVTVPRKVHTRPKSFWPHEIDLILKSCLAYENTTERPFDATRRWVPWLLAYTGARAGEITQLRGKDVIQQDGVWAIHITPEAGTVKTREARTVPIHEHLVEQGFIRFVHSNGNGPLFYDAMKPVKNATSDPTNPRSPPPVIVRGQLAEWVRKLGVVDKELKPNHAWRHTFKQIADRVHIPEKMSDFITGHSPASIGRSYGTPAVSDMAEALKKFPRYEINLHQLKTAVPVRVE